MRSFLVIALMVLGFVFGWLVADACINGKASARGIAIRVDQGIGIGIPQGPSAARWYAPRRTATVAPTASVQGLGQGLAAPGNGCRRPAFEAVSGPDRGTCYGN